MIQISYEIIKEKIKEQLKLSDEEIDEKINKKIEELSDLVSKDGAAQIVANELKVKLFEVGKIKIKDILIGMRNFEINGKVMNLSEVREFKTKKREGKMVSFLFGDETGVIRCVVWDENIVKKVEEGSFKNNEIINLKNGHIRDNNGAEIHIGTLSKLIINPKGVEIGEVNSERLFERREGNRKKISELQDNEFNVSVLGTIVQVFEPRFYEACNECGKKVNQEEGEYVCGVHGKCEIKYMPVLNLFFDDGTDNIRVAAFRENVNELLKIEDVSSLRGDGTKFEEVRRNILGNQVILNGRITKNEMFDRKELLVNSVNEVNPEELLKELEKNDV